MRSLSAKLLLAFALTSLAGIALAALFVRQFVVQEFDAYVLEQRRTAFVEQATAYYIANGGWSGVSYALADAQTTTPAFHDDNFGGPGGPRDRVGFILADQSGTIVLSPNPLQRGQRASSAELSRGIAITLDGETIGTVLAFGPPGRNPAEDRYLARTDQALAVAALGAIVVALALGLLLARLITRPVRDLTAATRAIAAGDLRQEVPVRSRDELGALARQFNQMSADLHRATELRRRMTADIAHDLRTPLTVISGYLEAMRDEALRPTPARFAAMHDETQVLLRLVEDLHTLSLADAGELVLKRQPVAPQELLARVAQTYGDAAAQAGVRLELRPAPALPPLAADAEQLLRALGNLVSNALRHTPAGGQVTLEAGHAEQGVTLEVRDTGEGIPAEHLPNIFERFYRADSSRHQATGGSGLGLAIVRSIVAAHGGRIDVASSIGQGSRFTITLPAKA